MEKEQNIKLIAQINTIFYKTLHFINNLYNTLNM